MLMSCSDTSFLKFSAPISLKVATNGSFRGKKIQNFSILKAFLLKQKRWSPTKKTVSDKFDISITCSAAYFLEVGARVSLKVFAKGSFRDKKTLKVQIFRLLF